MAKYILTQCKLYEEASTYCSLVVRAVDEAEARNLAESYSKQGCIELDSWLDGDIATCEELPITRGSGVIHHKVICCDFSAIGLSRR